MIFDKTGTDHREKSLHYILTENVEKKSTLTEQKIIIIKSKTKDCLKTFEKKNLSA